MINTVTAYFMYLMQIAGINLATNTIKGMLMRSGFVFNPAYHKHLKNIQTNTGSIALTWQASDSSVNRGSGSFITDGFVPGNLCTSTDGSNPGNLYIATVSALKITFVGAIINSSGTEALTSNDELAGGYGYTAGGITLTVTVTEDDANNKSDATFLQLVWTPSGGSIGPTTGVIFYNSTADCIQSFAQHIVEVTYPIGQDAVYGGGDFRNGPQA